MTKEDIIHKMLLVRRVEEEVVKRYPKQQMRLPVHLSLGQEAIAVGVCHHLRQEDKVFSTHRCHAHYLAKAGSLEKMALELHGKVGGCTEGRGGSMQLMDTDVNVMSIPIVASAIPLAVGAALANKMDGNDNIVVCFFGDAAMEEGVFHESMSFASLMRLPIIFVCENNQYSVDTHLKKRQPSRDWDAIAAAYSMESVTVYTNNVLDIAKIFEKLINNVRQMCMPYFVVAETRRSYVHCGIDKEFELENDPLDIAKDCDDTEIVARITTVFDAAETAALPTPDRASRFVYA